MFSNPIHWRLRAQRYRLAGALCARCGEPLFPPRLLCRDCVERQQDAHAVCLANEHTLDRGRGVDSISNLCLQFVEAFTAAT